MKEQKHSSSQHIGKITFIVNVATKLQSHHFSYNPVRHLDCYYKY